MNSNSRQVLLPLAKSLERFLREELDWNTADVKERKICTGKFCRYLASEFDEFCSKCGSPLKRNNEVDKVVNDDLSEALQHIFKENGYTIAGLKKIRKIKK